MNKKSWFTSKTVWAGIAGLAVAALRQFGIDIDDATLTDGLFNLATAIAAISAIYGRAVASTSLE